MLTRVCEADVGSRRDLRVEGVQRKLGLQRVNRSVGHAVLPTLGDRSAVLSPSRCSPRAGTPGPSPTSWAAGPSARSSSASASTTRRTRPRSTASPHPGAEGAHERRRWETDPRSSRITIWELRFNLTTATPGTSQCAEALAVPLATLDARLSKVAGPSCGIPVARPWPGLGGAGGAACTLIRERRMNMIMHMHHSSDEPSTVRRVRLFRNGRNQAVRIPRDFELDGSEPPSGGKAIA